MGMINKVNATMVGGGSAGVIGANSQVIDKSVNLLHYPIWGNSEIFITPSTVISVVGFCIAVFGLYRAFKKRK